MCGIIGYIGPKEATPLLLSGLRRMEHRGYDSAGVAVSWNGELHVRKQSGKIQRLAEYVGDSLPPSTLGIAHTRWATHGPPTTENAHPHVDCKSRIAVVHNGIIENANTLKKSLQETFGHEFQTETDTEVLAHLIEEAYEGTLEDAVLQALAQVEGAYGIAVISADDPDKIVAARFGSPLLIGLVEDGGFLIASDPAAVVSHTREVIHLDDGDLAVLSRDGHSVTNFQKERRVKEISHLASDIRAVKLRGFDHFMIQEIHDQPESIRNTMRGRILDDGVRLGGLERCLSPKAMEDCNRIVLTACGTSWHAALIAEYMLEDLTRIPTEVEYASELRYRNPVLDERSIVIAISQSGETKDTLEAVRESRRHGARLLGVVNVVGSAIARESGCGMYLHAGPEIGVASTKAFTSQVVALALLTLYIGRHRGIRKENEQEIIQKLMRLPDQISEVLKQNDHIRRIAEQYMDYSNALYLGRGYNFPVALEGALKLKEISYIHAEGMSAAEMKHGSIALIDENMPVVVIAPHDNTIYKKVLSNVQEVKTRGGRIIAITTNGTEDLCELADHVISVPSTIPMLQPVLTVIPLQLLAYHIAVLRGCDVDQPRNLAKSVTVE